MDKRDTRAIRRFCLKGAILSAFALAGAQSCFRDNATLLFAFAAILDAGIAFARREALMDRNFTYWDEAAVFVFVTIFLITF